MKRNTDLTSTFTNGFDTDGTLTGQSLSKAHPEPLRRIARKRCLVLLAALCVVSTTPANATKAATQTDYLKLYLHTKTG